DVARHAGEADIAGRERVEADVAGDRLRVDRSCDRASPYVAGDALHREVAVDAVDLDVAADRLDRRVLGDIAAQPDVTRGRVQLEGAEVPGELGVRGCGLDPHRCAVGHTRLDAQSAVPEQRAERDAGPALVGQ